MVSLVAIDTLLLWQQRHVLITSQFEVVGISYLVPRSNWVIAIYGVICCYGHLVTMATESCSDNFTFWSCRTSYLVQRSIEATATCGMICCYGHLVTMATEACTYSFTIWSCRNVIFGTEIHWGNNSLWYDLLLWTPCYHGNRGMCL